MVTTRRQVIGEQAERMARTMLEAAGLVWVAGNVRYKVGELDLIMQDGPSSSSSKCARVARRRSAAPPAASTGASGCGCSARPAAICWSTTVIASGRRAVSMSLPGKTTGPTGSVPRSTGVDRRSL